MQQQGRIPKCEGEKQTGRLHIIQFHYMKFSKGQNYGDKNIDHRLSWAHTSDKGLRELSDAMAMNDVLSLVLTVL